MSLKERVEGNELDLSLNQLREVPVKELAAATKASQLDLSSNLIETLPREFSTLTHLIKIDLSNNRLKELPDNFGNLHNLQYLDLYSNKLVILPLSFCRLKNLQWLDLKNNPLDPSLKTIAGDCLDEKQCRACAKKVVVYMQEIESNVERVRQKLLKIEREKEAKEKAKMEKVLEEQRRLKKLEREKRKAESKAKKEAQLLLEKGQQDSQEERERLSEEEEDMDEVQETSAVRGGNFHTKAMLILLSIALCISFLYLMWADSSDFFSVAAVKVAAQKYLVQVESNFYKALKLVKYYIPIIKEYVLRIVHYYMVTMTHFASQIEHILSLYF